MTSRRRVRRREEREREARAAAERERAARARRLRRIGALAGGVALVALGVVVAVLLVGRGSDAGEAPAPTVASTPVPVPEIAGARLAAEEFDGIEQSGGYLGDPLAPYTLVEFGDLVCPPCATFSKEILPPVVERYVRTGQLRMQFQPINLTRDQSALAGQYAWAAGKQDRLWDFVTLWYRNQGDEDTPYVTDEFARAIAAKIPGLDADRLIADAHQPETRRRLDDFARRFVGLGFTVVPSFAAGPSKGEPVPIDLGESATTATRAVQLLVATGGG